jgi:hypothetical protein
MKISERENERKERNDIAKIKENEVKPPHT